MNLTTTAKDVGDYISTSVFSSAWSSFYSKPYSSTFFEYFGTTRTLIRWWNQATLSPQPYEGQAHSKARAPIRIFEEHLLSLTHILFFRSDVCFKK